MNWRWHGRAWVFGHDVPNDNGLMPIQWTRQQQYDPAVLAPHAFADLDPALAARIRPGDIVVGGRNFGHGNPHVQGFLGLKGLGVAVLAETMGRGPLRACVNAGVPLLAPVPGLSSFASTGDLLAVDFEQGTIVNETRGTQVQAPALAPIMRDIIDAGGGLSHMRRRAVELGLL